MLEPLLNIKSQVQRSLLCSMRPNTVWRRIPVGSGFLLTDALGVTRRPKKVCSLVAILETEMYPGRGTSPYPTKTWKRVHRDNSVRREVHGGHERAIFQLSAEGKRCCYQLGGQQSSVWVVSAPSLCDATGHRARASTKN